MRLPGWLKRPVPDRRVRQVTLYGKPGCHLCEDTRVLLDDLAQRYPMQVDEVDITTNQELFRRYDIVIPVVLIDGTVELSAPIGEPELTRALSS